MQKIVNYSIVDVFINVCSFLFCVDFATVLASSSKSLLIVNLGKARTLRYCKLRGKSSGFMSLPKSNFACLLRAR